MPDVIKEAVIRLGIEQVPTKLIAPDLKPVEQSYQKVTEAIDRTSAAAKKNAVDVEAANLRVLESSKLAGEGAFTMARGFTLLGASGSESVQQIVRSLAIAQGAFDIFKGATDLVKGLTEAQRALEITTKATTAAEVVDTQAKLANATAATAAAGANTAAATGVGLVGAAATASLAPVIAFAAALAPVLLPLALLGAAILLVANAYKTLSDRSKEAAESERSAANARRDYFADTNRDFRDRIQRGREAGASQFDQRATDAELAARQAALTDVLEDNNISSRRGVNEQSRAARLRAAAEQIEAANELVVLQDRRVAISENQLRVAEQVNRAEIEAVKLADDKLQRAKEQLEVENDRVKSIQAQIGSLNELEQAELRRLAQRVQRGDQLSNAELERLRQLGGGRTAGFVEEQFAQRGAGLDAELRGVFGGDRREELQGQVGRLAEELSKLTEGISGSAKIAELEAERDAAVAEAKATADTTRQVLEQMLGVLENVQQRVDQIENSNR